MRKIFVIFTLLGAMFAESQNGFFSEVGAGIGYYRYDEPQVMNTDDLLLNLNAKLGYRHHFIKTEGIGNVFVAFGFNSLLVLLKVKVVVPCLVTWVMSSIQMVV